MLFKKFFISLFFLPIIVLPALAENELVDTTVKFMLEKNRSGIQYLHTPFLQTLTYSPKRGDMIISNFWIEKTYVVNFSSKKTHIYYKDSIGWHIKIILYNNKIVERKLTYIGLKAADDIYEEQKIATTKITLCNRKITVKNAKTDILLMPSGWQYRVFNRGKLIILINEDQYFPFSGHFTKKGELIWSCTHEGVQYKFENLNNFFFKEVNMRKYNK